MRFLDELKEKRQDAIENVAGIDIDIEATKITLKSEQEQRAFWTKRIAEIDIAIAALKAADDHAYFAEKATAREQLEREPEIEPVPIDEQDDASEFAEPVELVHDVSDLLTGPERMVQAAPDEAPALNSDMQDEREQPVTDVAALIASGEHSYDEVAAIAYPEPQWNEPQPTEGYATVTSPTIDDLIPEAMRQELEAEQRYAQPTNAAADEAAKAHDYYSLEKIAARQKFNPFGIFRREDA